MRDRPGFIHSLSLFQIRFFIQSLTHPFSVSLIHPFPQLLSYHIHTLLSPLQALIHPFNIPYLHSFWFYYKYPCSIILFFPPPPPHPHHHHHHHHRLSLYPDHTNTCLHICILYLFHVPFFSLSLSLFYAFTCSESFVSLPHTFSFFSFASLYFPCLPFAFLSTPFLFFCSVLFLYISYYFLSLLFASLYSPCLPFAFLSTPSLFFCLVLFLYISY